MVDDVPVFDEELREFDRAGALAPDTYTLEVGSIARTSGSDDSFAAGVALWGLDFEVVYTGSEDGTRAELSLATARQDPILLYWWSPTAEVVEYDLVKVELPSRTQDCLDAHAAGALMSCDYTKDVLFKVATPGLAESDPDLYHFLSQFSLTTADQLDLIYAVERTGRSIADVAEEWVDTNEQIWSGWLPTR